MKIKYTIVGLLALLVTSSITGIVSYNRYQQIDSRIFLNLDTFHKT